MKRPPTHAQLEKMLLKAMKASYLRTLAETNVLLAAIGVEPLKTAPTATTTEN